MCLRLFEHIYICIYIYVYIYIIYMCVCVFVFSLCQVAVAVKVNTLPGEPVAWHCWPLTGVGLLVGFRLWHNACRSCKMQFLQGMDLPFESHLFARCVAVPWVVLVLANWNQLSREFPVNLDQGSGANFAFVEFRTAEEAPVPFSPLTSSCERRRRWDLSTKAANGLRLNGVELLGCQLKAGQKKTAWKCQCFCSFLLQQKCQRIIKSSDIVDLHTLCIRFAYVLDSRFFLSLQNFQLQVGRPKGYTGPEAGRCEHGAHKMILEAHIEPYCQGCDGNAIQFMRHFVIHCIVHCVTWDENLFSCLSQNDNVMLWQVNLSRLRHLRLGTAVNE